MVALDDILDAITATLAEEFTQEIHVDDVPQDFSRPCLLVEITNMSAADHTRWTELITVTARITAFAEVDDYGSAPQAEVLLLQQRVRACFGTGLVTGDRVLSVKPAAAQPGLADGVITLTITYADDRDTRPSHGLMAAITTNLDTEE